MLQIGRSLLRSQLVSLEFFVDIKSFRSHYGSGVDPASNRNEYQVYFRGVEAVGASGWQPYHHPVPLSRNLGTLNFWKPLCLSKPVMGLLYLYLTLHISCLCSVPPDDGLQICPKNLEVDWRNKLRLISASSWLLLHRHIKIHGQQNIKTQILTFWWPFISVINQLNALNLFHNKFYFIPLHVSNTCAHHQEVKIALHILWYHHTYRCNTILTSWWWAHSARNM